jgi:hypothetical protein
MHVNPYKSTDKQFHILGDVRNEVRVYPDFGEKSKMAAVTAVAREARENDAGTGRDPAGC